MKLGFFPSIPPSSISLLARSSMNVAVATYSFLFFDMIASTRPVESVAACVARIIAACRLRHVFKPSWR